MKKLFYQLVKWLIIKLLKMYTNYQVNSITQIIDKVFKTNSYNKVQLTSNSQLNKLLYEITIEQYSLTLTIELTKTGVNFMIESIGKLDYDLITSYNIELNKYKELIKQHFIIIQNNH